ncbi:uncharacterized protein LOC131955895 [Physella acuta]|uniref:uncharacterized protein LOC131955895 n=1 Tax=Physella acuta TaxID=109671 RepID=UPI0027DD0D16|nr:uncharacterized protein LOC131955895 [Physella acuta]XP_059176184.1 uncharacterized protein LOC131955895 [Physella acuta]
MASAYLGPERHPPLSVISESFQTKLNIPTLLPEDMLSFGVEYEKTFYSLVDEYLQLGTTDKLIYIGDTRGSIAQIIEEKFCLIQPVQTVVPGHFHYVETEDGYKVLPIRISHVGAEEFFRNLTETQSTEKFDRILLNDCVRYLEEPRTMYQNMLKCLTPNGRILLIHRPAELTTLPYFTDAKHRLVENELSYTEIIKDLQDCRLDVAWQLECLPIQMKKKRWLGMLREKYPTQMEVLSQNEVVSGIRELTEGSMKYQGCMVEFNDRLLFITATPCQQQATVPSLHRKGADQVCVPQETCLKFTMKVSPKQLTELTEDVCCHDE